MWDSLPWFVQLAIEIGSALFLYTVAMEAVLRTLKIVALPRGVSPAEIEAWSKPKQEKLAQ